MKRAIILVIVLLFQYLVTVFSLGFIRTTLYKREPFSTKGCWKVALLHMPFAPIMIAMDLAYLWDLYRGEIR